MEISTSKPKRLVAVIVPGRVADPVQFVREKLHVTKSKTGLEYSLSLAPDLEVTGRSAACSHLLFSSSTKELAGSVSEVVSFTAMPDFAFSDVDPATHIYPYAISCQTQPQAYLPTEPIKERAGDADALMSSKWLSGLLARFSDSELPTGPETEKADKLAVESGTTAMLGRVRAIFAERPVWQMAALQEQIGEELLRQVSPWKVLESIRSVSYFMVDGPFRNTHVRFGFDPRASPEARLLQSMDFRDPWFKQRNVRRAQASVAVQGGGAEAEQLADEDEETDEVVDCHFRVPPVKRNQCYQFMDIEDSVIQTLLRTALPTPQCSFKSGWFTEEVIELIRSQLKIRSEELRKKHK